MRVLITGGTGFVGCQTVAVVVAAGHQVRLLVRSPDRVAAALGPLGAGAVESVAGNVMDSAAVERAMNGCDAVIHAASVYSFEQRDSAAITATNVAGTGTVLGAAVRAGLDPIVYVSSFIALGGRAGATLAAGSPVGRPLGPYSESKAAAERVARRYQAEGAPVVITYPCGVYGPGDPYLGENTRSTISMLGGRWVLTAGGGFPVTDVRDLATLHAALLRPGLGPRRYIAPALNVSLAGMYGALRAVTGRALPTRHLPVRPLLPALRLLDVAKRVFGLDLPASFGAAYILSMHYRVDCTPAGRDLGVAARPLTETMADTVRWLLRQRHITPGMAGRLAA